MADKSEDTGVNIDDIISERQKEISALSKSARPPKTQAEPEKTDHSSDDVISERASSLPLPPAPEPSLDSTPPAPTQAPTKAEIIGENLLRQAKGLTGSDAGMMASSAGAGYLLPKAIEGVFPGLTATPENELLYRQNMERLKHEQATNPFEAYAGKSKNLMAQQQFTRESFAESQRRLNDAIAHHEMSKTLTLNDFLPPEFRTTLSTPESVLSRQPIGGEATSNYAQKFGLTPIESLEAPSMSKVQQKIPSVADAITRAQQVGPGFGKFQESSLLLGPEGQQYAMEQKQQREAIEENARRKLAEHKAQAQINLENAKTAHDMNMKALRDVNKAIESHVQPGVPPTVSPEEQRLKTETERYGGAGTAGRVLSLLGRKVLPRFSPVVAGAMAPEQALAAKKAYEQGEYGRAAAHGLGAVGSLGMMTGIPVLSGLGMVSNIPSLYYEGEDLMKPPPAKKP